MTATATPRAHRLTNHDRRAILRKLLAGFHERQATIQERKNRLGSQIYNARFSLKERKLMESLPEGWLPTVDHISVEIPGGRESFDFEPSVRVPNSVNSYNPCLFSAHDMRTEQSHLLDKIVAFNKELAAVEKECQAASREARGILWGCSTAKKLFEVWPEIKEVAEPLLGVPMVPAVINTARANELLGIG